MTPEKNCDSCTRLVAFRDENRRKHPEFYNGAVPSFGANAARLLVVGLAPGLKGANRTGRPFTGDYAGDVLYPALLRYGLARGHYNPDDFHRAFMEQESRSADRAFSRAQHVRSIAEASRPEQGQKEKDSLQLINTRITNAVRCVPPENKPTTEEVRTCNAYLHAEMAAMPHLRVVLVLGTLAHKALLRAQGLKQSAHPFAHGATHALDGYTLLCSYHTSRYNIQTGRLTREMFDTIIQTAKDLLVS